MLWALEEMCLLPVIMSRDCHVSGDVDGSLEAIMDTLDTYHSKKCRLDLVHFGIGNVTESDVELAKAFQGGSFNLLPAEGNWRYSIGIYLCVHDKM